MRSGILFLGVVCTSLFCASYQVASSASENQIRSQRQEIDKAFERHDAKRLATLFSAGCHFTTAAIHIDGGDALERSHETMFTRRPDVTLIHRTDRIVVNENWDVASERGEWVERWTEKDGRTELRGSYLGLWKRENGQWREDDEILVPETCEGSSYCH
ncbi:MAG TPA: nuclear transport factor 2 family protein [Candidatus Sulfotelmatobacter sp.]|nr:nuclear transport factor 2 family protein [Candidatus Sulfotelmatobacter sp.]